MPQNIINTVFPVLQGALAPNVTDPPSPGPAANNFHPAGVEPGAQAPGVGLPVQVPSFTKV
jgi:hypothetical protein